MSDQQNRATEVIPRGAVVAFVLNHTAAAELVNSLRSYIDSQKEAKTLVHEKGVVEPGTSGCTMLTTYSSDVAFTLTEKLKELRKTHPSIAYRKSYLTLDGSRPRRSGSGRGRGRGRGRGGRGRGQGNGQSSYSDADTDFSDTGSVKSTGSASSFKSNRSNKSTGSSKSFNLEGAKRYEYAVWVDGKGIKKNEWKSAKKPNGGTFNWYVNPRTHAVKAYINFSSAKLRDDWYADHHYIEVGDTVRKVVVVE